MPVMNRSRICDGIVNKPTRLNGRVGEEGGEERKNGYARFCFCKNSRRLRVASIVKTVSKETTKVDMNVSIAK